MTYAPSDQPHSQFGDYKNINDHYETEISLVRMQHDYNLKKDVKGNLYFNKEMIRWEEDDSIVTQERVITYKKDGEINIDVPVMKKGYGKYGRHTDMNSLLSYLPNSVGMYETGGNEKKYLLFDPDCDVRNSSYSPQVVWDITKSAHVKLFPNGSVNGAKKITRGDKRFADNKILEEQLEEKHYREMTKARLKGDLEIDYASQCATFRGCSTGTHHYCLEMYKPSSYGESGPNSGLIRRLFVGRFVNDSGDVVKCTKLALEIVKNIPDSCLSDRFKRLRHDSKES